MRNHTSTSEKRQLWQIGKRARSCEAISAVVVVFIIRVNVVTTDFFKIVLPNFPQFFTVVCGLFTVVVVHIVFHDVVRVCGCAVVVVFLLLVFIV